MSYQRVDLTDDKVRRRFLARHEASHAVVGHVLGCTVYRVFVDEQDGEFREGKKHNGQGYAEIGTTSSKYRPFDPMRWAVIHSAGCQGQLGKPAAGVVYEVTGDDRDAMENMGKFGGDYVGIRGVSMVAAAQVASALVRRYWGDIARVAKSLEKRSRMTRKEFLGLVKAEHGSAYRVAA